MKYGRSASEEKKELKHKKRLFEDGDIKEERVKKNEASEEDIKKYLYEEE
jgi:hypothetical protein